MPRCRIRPAPQPDNGPPPKFYGTRDNLTDPHGTATLRLDNTTQTPTWRQATPYGGTRGTQPDWPDNRTFLNKPTDPTTGLTRIGARSYDPVIGRFTTVDPVLDATNPQTLNGYTYAANNPTTNSDPTGLCISPVTDDGVICEDNGKHPNNKGISNGGHGGGGGSHGGGGISTLLNPIHHAARAALHSAIVDPAASAWSLITHPQAAGQAWLSSESCGLMFDFHACLSYLTSMGKGTWEPIHQRWTAGDESGAIGYAIGDLLPLLLTDGAGEVEEAGTIAARTATATEKSAAETGAATARPSTFVRTEALSGRGSARTVQELTDSMRTNGWQGDPIKVVELNGERIVVDGHHRLAAAQRAGIDVPYEVVDPSTVIGPGQWSSVDDILRDAASVGPNRIR